MIISHSILKTLYALSSTKTSNYGTTLDSVYKKLGIVAPECTIVDPEHVTVKPLEIIEAPRTYGGANYEVGRPVLITSYYHSHPTRVKASYVTGICFGSNYRVFHGNWLTSSQVSSKRLTVEHLLPLIPDGDVVVDMASSFNHHSEGFGIRTFAEVLSNIKNRLAATRASSH